MSEETLGHRGGNTVLLFGSQILSIDELSLRRLHAAISNNPENQWIFETILQLPNDWDRISKACPKLVSAPGKELLLSLTAWARTGTFGQQPKLNLRNILLSPIVVITHLTEYVAYLKTLQHDSKGGDIFSLPRPELETVGLCTGILSAMVVSSSTKYSEFTEHGARAIRLAMLIGALVDANDVRDGDSKTLSTAWKSPESAEEVQRILREFPEAYISVIFDENRVSVTTSQATISALKKRFQAADIIATEIGLRGRFHAECHDDDLETLFEFCNNHVDFQLPDASGLSLPTRSNTGGNYLTKGRLHEIALRTILIDQSKWYQTFVSVLSSSLNGMGSSLITFGPERSIPPSLVTRINARISHSPTTHGTLVCDSGAVGKLSSSNLDQSSDLTISAQHQRPNSENDVAVIGMSCKVPGAEDLESFWDLLVEGRSQHKEVDNSRFGFKTAFRDDDGKRKWYGNFFEDYDAFDHKFFKKSPRESATMDPQQRLLLQVAYQAVEQSGYFRTAKTEADRNIGCYIGVCGTDYEGNVACHPPNAFSSTGNLRSFIAGKISHYFGWTGPGMTIDTACSASFVSIHQACKDILSGDCTAALAGGTNMLTSPIFFQNLAAASFLSPTGQCKPFDVKADGYCRGEAIAVVFLKRLSAAIADGDQILGTIAGTAVQQNENCTPIFVPNVPSLASLFRNVLHKSGVDAKEVSVVEAHGTGTPVGDPAEYEVIRQVLGKVDRSEPLQLGSVKGLVGHTEGSSGAVSLIKILLMIQKGFIPPQASFNELSPLLNASKFDNVEITTRLKPWNKQLRAALINNYGASGSNASMIVTQRPRLEPDTSPTNPQLEGLNHPFWFAGFDDQSIRAYAEKFRRFLKSNAAAKQFSIANLAFNVSRQSNWNLDKALIFSCRTVKELDQKLTAFTSGDQSLQPVTQLPSRPVILCFGGQNSTFVGLDPEIYDKVAVFKQHLDECDSVCRTIGAGSIFPRIFDNTPVQDPAQLQMMLFSMQYACAKSWISCGIQPAAVVGHSFGELTALCISEVLSLDDAIKLVVGRATIIRDSWGPEKGSMMAVEGDIHDVRRLLAESGKSTSETPASIACFNGPRSFTLAGSEQSIDAVGRTITDNPAFRSIKSKKINVTNAFHSALVDPLMADLKRVGSSLQFKEPKIQFERATEFRSEEHFTSNFVSEHMRSPVYFNDAVQRLQAQYPSSVWIEASPNSTVTKMASRALGTPKDCYFQSLNITSGNGLQQLMDTTMSLWKAGVRVTNWAHSTSQTYQYDHLILPPYQFNKQRHWMEFKEPEIQTVVGQTQNPLVEDVPTTLWTFMGYQDGNQQHARFRINTTIKKYEDIISGHLIAQTAPICPATLQVDLAVEVAISLVPDFTAAGLVPQIRKVVNQTPMCVDHQKIFYIDLERQGGNNHTWSWKIFSTGKQDNSSTTYVLGTVALVSADDPGYQLEFGRFERLIQHQRCLQILESEDADDVVQGRSIYKIFSDVVDYGSQFFGLRKLVGKKNESAGIVSKRHSGETWLDPFLGDCFSQVAGMWVNCMTDRKASDMYIATGFDQWTRSPKSSKENMYAKRGEWHVLAHHDTDASENSYISDIFVFDPITGGLAEMILGVQYSKVAKNSMSRILSRLTSPGDSRSKTLPPVATGQPEHIQTRDSLPLSMPLPPSQPLTSSKSNAVEEPAQDELIGKLKEVLAEISGLEVGEIQTDAELADLGIDSLLGMEMAHEIESTFDCTLPADDLMQVTDFQGLLSCLKSGLGIVDNDENGLASKTSASTESQSDSSLPTDNTPLASSTAESSVSDPRDGIADYLNLSSSAVLAAFGESKLLTDQFIIDHQCSGYMSAINPRQSQLCVALTVEAFEQLGVSLKSAQAGQSLQRVSHLPEHARLVDYLYQMLEETRLVNLDGANILRTALAIPDKSSGDILRDLERDFPNHTFANQLSFWTGSKLADVLTGKTDGLKLIFATEKGRELVSGLYGDSQLNKLSYKQMCDFLTRLVSKLIEQNFEGPLKILEMGAGTGGTTKWLVPLLAGLNMPFEYTFTDLSPSLVAGARKRFKEYPSMKFRVHDIEKVPADELLHSQHIVIASNAVHATRNLATSTKNIHKMLRPDGFLMMLEMTQTLHWVDIIFGVLEGWWLFEDGRKHAIAHQSRWKREFESAGYGHVEWTDGSLPEVNIQRIFIACASEPRLEHDLNAPVSSEKDLQNYNARRVVVDGYVEKYVTGFRLLPNSRIVSSSATCILVTGASGSLGAHLVAHLANLPHVERIVCLNRSSNVKPYDRQMQAFKSRGISLDDASISKLLVFDADTAKPFLGLPQRDYESLLDSVTHIVHGAWPMSGKLPVKGFKLQFEVMRNLIDLASGISSRRPRGFKVTFQFISSIATVGYFPIWSGKSEVPEERVVIESVLPNGYGDAKFVCERMLDETLLQHPDKFRTMSVRLGQVAGSSKTGYWNHMEHFAFMLKSSQTLKKLPDFDGQLSWTPVDHVAASLGDFLFSDADPHPFYHIDNPVRQPWKAMIPVLADALDVPPQGIIPFSDWVKSVRDFPGPVEWDNPAFKLVDFFDNDFVRMSCGGVLLETTHSREHSQTMRGVGPVDEAVARRYIQAWKESGFLRK